MANTPNANTPEKDPITGRSTTGHEWDGIAELNTPLPKWWVYVFVATIVVSLGQFVLYPSFPTIRGYIAGTAGWSQRAEVDQAVKEVTNRRAAHMDKIAKLDFADIRKDPQLNAVALTAGRIAFANNCQACHGAGGEGRIGYPALGDDVWLWGGTVENIARTVRVGIRSDHADTLTSTMPAFGATLKPEEINAVTDYVMSLYGTPVEGRDIAQGQKLYAENCAACHGAQGEGNMQQGGPRLAAQIHLLKADRETVYQQIVAPRMGMMPAWNTRLDEATIKALALYVHQLGGGQ